jgi:hypothetical protein
MLLVHEPTLLAVELGRYTEEGLTVIDPTTLGERVQMLYRFVAEDPFYENVQDSYVVMKGNRLASTYKQTQLSNGLIQLSAYWVQDC